MKPPTLVLDVSVVADALARPAGPAGELVKRLVTERDYELLSTRAILDDLETRLTRPSVLELLELDAERVVRWVRSLGILATALEDEVAEGLGREAVRDPYVAAARRAGGATVLVVLETNHEEGADDAAVVRLEPERVLELLEARRLGALVEDAERATSR